MSIRYYIGDRLAGLSTDTKPTDLADGAVFYETNTLKQYLKVNNEWKLMTEPVFTLPTVDLNISPSSFEIGSTVSSLNFYWTLNKDLTSLSIDPDVGTVAFSSGSHSLLSEAVTAFTSNKTFTISGADENSSCTDSVTVSFLHKRFWGTSDSTTLTEAEIEALENSELSSSYSKSFSIDGGGKYVYYCYPAAWGTCKFYIGGFYTTLIQDTVSVSNAYGHTEDYYTFRTQYKQNGTGISFVVTS